MRILRTKHRPSGRVFIVDRLHGRVFGAHSGSHPISLRDRAPDVVSGVRTQDLLNAARDFEALWKWPAYGTRFPQRDPRGAAFPSRWFRQLDGRLNQLGPDGDLEFRGYLDAVEQRRFLRGGPVRVERSALELHWCALDYALTGELGLSELYHGYVGNRLRPRHALWRALSAFLIFGRGRPVRIERIDQRRPAQRSRGFDANGCIDRQILQQYRALFDTTRTDEIDQAKLAHFNDVNFPSGFVSSEHWRSFFATCAALNQRSTVTYRQLLGFFDSTLEFVASSKLNRHGRRPLDRVLSD